MLYYSSNGPTGSIKTDCEPYTPMLDISVMRYVLYSLLACAISVSPVYATDNSNFSVLTQNLNRLFNDVDDGQHEKVVSRYRYRKRIDQIVNKIHRQHETPEIIAIQEVENIDVLRDIAEGLTRKTGVRYQVILIEGFDSSGIDVGYLIQNQVSIKQQHQLFRKSRIKTSNSPLFTRPPLLVEVCFKPGCITLVNLHLRSMRGLRSHKKGKRVALKRLQQATALAQWVDHLQKQNPGLSLMLLGDFNALTPPDNFVDTAGTIRGKPVNHRVKYPAKDWIEDDLIDLTKNIDQSRRFSYVFKQQKQILDYMLVNQHFKPKLQSIAFSKIDQKFSDHAGLLANFVW